MGGSGRPSGGGRRLSGGYPDFTNWSGVANKNTEEEDEDADDGDGEGDAEAPAQEPEEPRDPCGPVVEMRHGRSTGAAPHRLCDAWSYSPLETSRPPDWALGDDAGLQVVRMAMGRGSVTVINARPFRWRNLFRGDHGWLFVHAAQLKRGDAVSSCRRTPIPRCSRSPGVMARRSWCWGWPASPRLCGADPIGTGLHRPAAAPRRSLAEQIRGTGRFLARRDVGALHAAAVRALDEEAARRISGYATRSLEARVRPSPARPASPTRPSSVR